MSPEERAAQMCANLTSLEYDESRGQWTACIWSSTADRLVTAVARTAWSAVLSAHKLAGTPWSKT